MGYCSKHGFYSGLGECSECKIKKEKENSILTLEKLLTKKEPKEVDCFYCNGTGDMYLLPTSPYDMLMYGSQGMRMSCMHCNGTGKKSRLLL